MYFRTKNTLKSNHNHTSKHPQVKIESWGAIVVTHTHNSDFFIFIFYLLLVVKNVDIYKLFIEFSVFII
jgi:hypothetical protein